MLIKVEKLQALVIGAGVLPTFLRDYFFSVPKYYPNGEVEILIEKNGQQVAPFVSPEIGGEVMERDGKRLDVYTPPEIAPQRVITTKNLLAAAGNSEVTIIEAGSTPESRQAKLIKDDFDDMEKAITRREEMSCAEVLTTGKLTVKGPGYNDVINFWDDADKPFTALAGAALWSAATADPLVDIEFGVSQTQERSGVAATDVVMNASTWALARGSEKLLKQLDTTNLNVGEVFTANDLNKMGARLVGRLAGVNIWSYNATFKAQDDEGVITSKKALEDGIVLFGSPNAKTELAYGVVSITDVKNQTLKHISARRVANQYLSQKNPAGIVNELKTAVLPVPTLVDGFYVLQVI